MHIDEQNYIEIQSNSQYTIHEKEALALRHTLQQHGYLLAVRGYTWITDSQLWHRSSRCRLQANRRRCSNSPPTYSRSGLSLSSSSRIRLPTPSAVCATTSQLATPANQRRRLRLVRHVLIDVAGDRAD
jgi:hypothetical protein